MQLGFAGLKLTKQNTDQDSSSSLGDGTRKIHICYADNDTWTCQKPHFLTFL